ncbi:hypothetical protein SAMN05444392_104226 [Seinonella peptonophila]|uniref:Cell-wall binding lipoprotein n=2 Tax=Seinonella peptonophila TaxID=112248 RepID=A0A1M4XAB3_9BACL|nr:hypothetical protein SAMN05444392_104226 [Seinonella peptonophila]
MKRVMLTAIIFISLVGCSNIGALFDFGASEKAIGQISQLVNQRNAIHSKLSAGLDSSNMQWTIKKLEQSYQQGKSDPKLLQNLLNQINRSKTSTKERLNRTKAIYSQAAELKYNLHDLPSERKKMAIHALDAFIDLTAKEIELFHFSIKMDEQNETYYQAMGTGKPLPKDDYERLRQEQIKRNKEIKRLSDRFNRVWDIFNVEITGQKVKDPGAF